MAAMNDELDNLKAQIIAAANPVDEPQTSVPFAAIKGKIRATPAPSATAPDPITNPATGETLSQTVKKLRGYGWREKDIAAFQKSILGTAAPQQSAGLLDNLNPTGGLLVDYNPQARAQAPLADNMTTLDKTLGGHPDEMITVYRGAPKNQKSIAPGDFITTNRDLAQSYAGTGKVLQMKVRKGDILDDANEPTGEEYIYRPKADREKKHSKNK